MVLFSADHFNQQVAVDIVGPMPVTITGNRYMITIMDRFSRYLKIIPVPDMKTITVVRTILNHWIYLVFDIPLLSFWIELQFWYWIVWDSFHHPKSKLTEPLRFSRWEY